MTTVPWPQAVCVSHLTLALWTVSFPKKRILISLGQDFVPRSGTRAGTEWVLHGTHWTHEGMSVCISYMAWHRITLKATQAMSVVR